MPRLAGLAALSILTAGAAPVAASDGFVPEPPEGWHYYETGYGDDLIMEDDKQFCVGYYLPV